MSTNLKTIVDFQFPIVFVVAAAAAAPQSTPDFHINFDQDQNLNKNVSPERSPNDGQNQEQDPNQNRNLNLNQNQNQDLNRTLKRDLSQQFVSADQPKVILLSQNFDQDLAGNYIYNYKLSNGQQVRTSSCSFWRIFNQNNMLYLCCMK